MGEKSAKSFLKELKNTGVYYTPVFLAEKMKEYIDLPNIEEVYDPTCGQGNLFKVFDDNVKKYGQELDPVEMEKCQNTLTNFEGYSGDTLTDDKFAGREFQVVFANPPYSVAWEQFSDPRWDGPGALAPKSKADWTFGLHCLHHTKPDGICILLMFPGILYRGNAEQKIRAWLIENNYVDRVVSMSGVYMKKHMQFSDTSIAPVIIVLKKNRTTTDVVFEDLDIEKSETIDVDRIRQENYTLSVSTYVEKPDDRPQVDIDVLNNVVRQGDLIKIQGMLEREALLSELEMCADNYVQFVDEIDKIIEMHRKKSREMKEIIDTGDEAGLRVFSDAGKDAVHRLVEEKKRVSGIQWLIQPDRN